MGKFLSSLYKSHDVCVSVSVTSERNITRRCPEITHIVTSRIKRITNSRTEPLARNRKLIQTSDVVHTVLQLTTTHCTNSTASFPGQPGYGRYQEGKTSLDLNEARDYGVLGCSGISWTIYKQPAPRSRLVTTPTPHHSIFTGQMALPDAQTTVSKHWRQTT